MTQWSVGTGLNYVTPCTNVNCERFGKLVAHKVLVANKRFFKDHKMHQYLGKITCPLCETVICPKTTLQVLFCNCEYEIQGETHDQGQFQQVTQSGKNLYEKFDYDLVKLIWAEITVKELQK